MSEQPTLADVVNDINAVTEQFQAWNEAAVKREAQLQEIMNSLTSFGVVITPNYRITNAIDDLDAPVCYPDGVAVVPPLPRTQRDAKKMSGKDAAQCLTLLFGPQFNMPTKAQLRKERLWALLGLFGRKLY